MGSVSSFFAATLSTLWTWALLGFATFAGYQVSQERDLANVPGFDALPAFLRIPLQHQTESVIVFTLAGVLSGFLVFFLVGYVWQALQDFLRLEMVSQSLKKAQQEGRMETTSPDPEDDLTRWHWFYYPRMTHLWREYAETLHRQPSANPAHDATQVHYRATIPAEIIFSAQALVDVPMRVEFFRHLPGILTGAGIVSTFAGILLGLSEFNPAVEAQQITHQLKLLFTGITTAFVASFFAIFSAILVTILEKFLLHWRYAQITALQHRIDDIFRAGIEPEYLASLVNNGKAGFEQLHTEIGRLAVSMMAHMQQGSENKIPPPLPPQDAHSVRLSHDPRNHALDPTTVMASLALPQEPHALPAHELTQHLKGAIQEVLGKPLLEISQLLQHTMNLQGRRREDGRALEIQLVSAGERLDVALGEFAYAMAGLKEEMGDTNDTVKSIMSRQLDILEKINTHMAEVSTHLRQENDSRAVGKEVASLLHDALETQTSAIHAWDHSIQELTTKLPSEEALNYRIKETLKVQGAAFQQWTRSLDGLFQKLPSREEFIRLVRAERQHQTTALQNLQHTLDTAVGQLPEKKHVAQFLKNVQTSLDTLSRKLPEETLWPEMLQAMRADPSADLHETQQLLRALPDQLMAWADTQNQTLRSDILDGFAHHLQETTGRMASQFSQLEAQVIQERNNVKETLQDLTDQLHGQFQTNSAELTKRLTDQIRDQDAHHEIDAGLRIQGLADQLAEELQETLKKLTEKQQKQIQQQNALLEKRLQRDSAQLTGQVKTSLKEGVVDSAQKLHEQMLEMEKLQARSSQEVAEKISDVLYTRLEHTFGTLTKGLSELRERVTSERTSMVSTMESWRKDASRSDEAKAHQMDQKISEVITHINTQRTDLISVIDALNQNLSNDLDGMHSGLVTQNEESTQHVTRKVTELGRVLEGVVNSVGQEQTVFIEMLGERLETLRRRMKVK